MDSIMSDHPIFKTDPAEYMQYVHKEVCVETKDESSHTGWVYTVDPVSQSVVLATISKEGDAITKLEIVMGHNVQNIIVLNEKTELHKQKLEDLFHCDLTTKTSPEEIAQQKKKLTSWLLKNRLPVSVCKNNTDVLNVADALTIHPPYGPESCISTNEIILGRIQGLIKNMPKDVESW